MSDVKAIRFFVENSSKHFFFDNSKAGKCGTVDIHSEVPRHTVVL